MISASSRKPRLYLCLLLPLLIVGLGCKLLANAWGPLSSERVAPPTTASIIPTTAAPAPSPTAILEILPSPTASFTPLPTPTQLPATPTLHPTSTSTHIAYTLTPTPLPFALQMQIFEELWSIVEEEYLYPDFNGLDWNAVYQEVHSRIEAGLDNQAFYASMKDMITRLGDEHSIFLDPQEAREEDAEFAGELDYVGIGVLASPLPERQRAVILVVFPDSPAQQAGLKSHDCILEVDGQPILDEKGSLRNLLRGPEGSQVQLLIQTPDQQPRLVSLLRRRVSGPVPVPFTVLTTPGGKRIGYILLVTFVDQTIPEQVGRALQIMSYDRALDGVIVDNRMNGGGSSLVLSGALAYFTHGKVGNFVSRKEARPFWVPNLDMFGSQKMPMVVLIGRETMSFGEIFAGILQIQGRATLIGETTLGNVEILWGYDFDDGSRAWIAHDTFQPLSETEQNWEKTGIIPDIEAPVRWDEVTLETDPAVKAALEQMDR